MDIVVENITKRFGAQKAVDNVSFRVKAGEIVGFLGPNGAGKSTTMRAITCYLAPNEGDIRIGDYSIHQHPEEIKKIIGYLPELNPLYQEMPVLDYLRFIAELHGIPKQKINPRLLEMVHICGMEGEKHEKTVSLSSHILAEVEATCDRILIINKGRIVADGTSNDLRKRAQNKEILKLTIEEGDRNVIFKALQAMKNSDLVDILSQSGNTFELQSKPGTSSRRDVFQLCVEKGWILTEMTPTETKLEDVFRELTMN
jgi:ABC-2 type transport system ATP-binding protein